MLAPVRAVAPELSATPHRALAEPAHARAGVPFWFGPEGRPLFGWLHLPIGPAARGVVLCPPAGYEAWCSHRTYRKLAETLAEQGATVLRFDYDGTGDSAGHYADGRRVEAWRDSVRYAVAELSRRDVPEIALVGLRLGATLATLEAAGAGVQTLVLWDPVVSGRRFVRELKILSAANAASAETPSDGDVEIAGTVHTADTVLSLGQVDLLRAPLADVRRVLIVDREDRPAGAALAEAFRAAGADVERVEMAGTAGVLDVPNEDAVVPEDIVAAIVRELAPKESPPSGVHLTGEADVPAPAKFEWSNAAIVEEGVRIGRVRLFGVLGRPAAGQPDHIVVLLNSGTEHHAGPGRVWVEFARAMNTRGIATLRADFNGVGDSPVRGPERRVRPYDPEFFDDIDDFVAFVRARGFKKVSVLGLCSGAWMAVHAGLQCPVDAVLAINPQLYWSQGDPVEALLSETRVRRTEEREVEEWGRRYGVWSALDVVGVRPHALRWLEGLDRRRVKTLLAFAKGDDGLEHLELRCHRGFERLLRRGTISKVEVAGIDHPMHRHRKRPEMLAQVLGFAERV